MNKSVIKILCLAIVFSSIVAISRDRRNFAREIQKGLGEFFSVSDKNAELFRIYVKAKQELEKNPGCFENPSSLYHALKNRVLEILMKLEADYSGESRWTAPASGDDLVEISVTTRNRGKNLVMIFMSRGPDVASVTPEVFPVQSRKELIIKKLPENFKKALDKVLERKGGVSGKGSSNFYFMPDQYIEFIGKIEELGEKASINAKSGYRKNSSAKGIYGRKKLFNP